MSKLIVPTVGRVVWFEPGQSVLFNKRGEQPMAAQIVFVHGDRLVNLSVFDHTGQQYAVKNVPLVQEDDAYQSDKQHCHWMPFQIGQQARTEAVEKMVLGVAAPARAAGIADPLVVLHRERMSYVGGSGEPGDESGTRTGSVG